MEKINKIFARFKEVVGNPNKVIDDFKKNKEQKVIGCFPVYCPEEIIHAAGMLPIGIWGGEIEIEESKRYFPAFACSIMQSCLELALKGKYDNLDGVIIPGMCDTLICLGQNWKNAIPNIPYIALVHPQNRKIQSGIDYLKSEYKNIKDKLEKIGGKEISNKDINKSIEVYNEHRKLMREFVDISTEYPHIITPYIRNLVIKSSFFMLKDEHNQLMKDLNSELKNKEIQAWKGKRILLSGIIADNKELLDILEENNLAVVSDDLAQETRQFRYDVPDGVDGLKRLAEYWSIFEGCSLAYDPEKKRGNIIAEEIINKKVDGVIFCMMKFCDPEEYDYPLMKKMIDKLGTKNLYLEIDQQMPNNEQVRTRIQTFAEMLSL